MKNNCTLIGVAMLLCLFWVDTASEIKAQVVKPDSVIIVEPQQQPKNVVWTDYRKPRKPRRQMPKMVLKLDGGYGWRIVETSDQLNADEKEYFKHLKSGFVWDASFDFFFNNMFGIRMAFYQYRASHSDQAYNTDTGKSGTLDTKDQITYIGPAFVFRLPLGQGSWIFDANVGMGYIGYKEKSTFTNEYYNFDGASVGIQTGVGLEYKFAPQWGIGVNMQITSGTITEFHHNDNGVKSTQKLEIEEGEGLGQISLGLGLRYYIK